MPQNSKTTGRALSSKESRLRRRQCPRPPSFLLHPRPHLVRYPLGTYTHDLGRLIPTCTPDQRPSTSRTRIIRDSTTVSSGERNSRAPCVSPVGTSPHRIRACTRRAQIPRQCTRARPAAQPYTSPPACPTRARHAVGTRSQAHCRLLGAVQGRTRTPQACSHQP